MTKKRFISLDFDGCLYNENIDNARAFHSPGNPKEDLTLEHLITINQKLIDHLNHQAKEFASSTVFLGSDRQDYKKKNSIRIEKASTAIHLWLILLKKLAQNLTLC